MLSTMTNFAALAAFLGIASANVFDKVENAEGDAHSLLSSPPSRVAAKLKETLPTKSLQTSAIIEKVEDALHTTISPPPSSVVEKVLNDIETASSLPTSSIVKEVEDALHVTPASSVIGKVEEALHPTPTQHAEKRGFEDAMHNLKTKIQHIRDVPVATTPTPSVTEEVGSHLYRTASTPPSLPGQKRDFEDKWQDFKNLFRARGAEETASPTATSVITASSFVTVTGFPPSATEDLASASETPELSGSGGPSCSNEGEWKCIGGHSFQRCAAGRWSPTLPVAPGTKCKAGVSPELNIEPILSVGVSL